jgi:hypothetical protein
VLVPVPVPVPVPVLRPFPHEAHSS